MKTVQVQKHREKNIDAKLDKIAELLEAVVVELKNEPHLKLSKKAEKAIAKGLKELKTGKYSTYKNFEAFKKAIG